VRANYIARDGLGSTGQYTTWESKPVFIAGLWCVPAGLSMFDGISVAGAKALIGKTLKKGEIWDHRRNTVKKG